jgi:hypothetical protein
VNVCVCFRERVRATDCGCVLVLCGFSRRWISSHARDNRTSCPLTRAHTGQEVLLHTRTNTHTHHVHKHIAPCKPHVDLLSLTNPGPLGRLVHGFRFHLYDLLYALNSLCKTHDGNVVGVECGLVDVAVAVTGRWQELEHEECLLPGSKASKDCSQSVLAVSMEILVRLVSTESCRRRMQDLKVHTLLDSLVQAGRGASRQHLQHLLSALAHAPRQGNAKNLSAGSDMQAEMLALKEELDLVHQGAAFVEASLEASVLQVEQLRRELNHRKAETDVLRTEKDELERVARMLEGENEQLQAQLACTNKDHDLEQRLAEVEAELVACKSDAEHAEIAAACARKDVHSLQEAIEAVKEAACEVEIGKDAMLAERDEELVSLRRDLERMMSLRQDVDTKDKAGAALTKYHSDVEHAQSMCADQGSTRQICIEEQEERHVRELAARDKTFLDLQNELRIAEAGHKESKAMIKALLHKIDEATEKAATDKQMEKELRLELTRAKEEADILRAELAKTISDTDLAHNATASAHRDLASITSLHQDLIKEMQNQQARGLSEQDTTIRDMQGQLKAREQEAEGLRRELTQTQSEMDVFRTDKDKLEAVAGMLRSETQELQARLASAENALFTAEEGARKVEAGKDAALAERDKAIEELQDKNASILMDLAEREESIRDQESRLKIIQDDKEQEITTLKHDLSAAAAILTTNVKDAEEEIMTLRQVLGAFMEEEKDAMVAEQNNAVQGLQDRYAMDLAEREKACRDMEDQLVRSKEQLDVEVAKLNASVSSSFALVKRMRQLEDERDTMVAAHNDKVDALNQALRETEVALTKRQEEHNVEQDVLRKELLAKDLAVKELQAHACEENRVEKQLQPERIVGRGIEDDPGGICTQETEMLLRDKVAQLLIYCENLEQQNDRLTQEVCQCLPPP